MRLTEKKAVVEHWASVFEESGVILLANYAGLAANEMNAIRGDCREARVQFHVVKNTLVRRALEGGKYAFLKEEFVGPMAVAVSVADQVAPARVLVKAAKDYDNFDLISGGLDGKPLDKAGIEQLSRLPGRDELRAQFLGLLNNVPAGFVRLLNAVPGGLVNILDARRRKLDEEAA